LDGSYLVPKDETHDLLPSIEMLEICPIQRHDYLEHSND